MADVEHQLRLLRFENFEVDLRTGELRKAGVKQKFGGQPFQVLSILLERPGDVVTREELQKRLWPDTFVDVDHNLNTAINKIREVLGDSTESPRFVETLPRRGYRFIGELEPPVLQVVPIVTVEPERGSRSRQTWLKIAAGVLAILVFALAGVLAYRWHRPQRPQEQEALTVIPFTAFSGVATSPAFSPDGSRISFAWNGDPKGGAKGFDLYVKAIGSETLLRLTQLPSEWISAAWSPDGTQIAFHRLAGADSGIYVVPALGGPERKLRPTRIAGETGSIISWSPDGKWIALADALQEGEHIRIYLLSTETLETKPIPISPQCVSEGLPAFSHNGEYLAYWCFRSVAETVLYSLPIAGGQPKMISLFQASPGGLAWSADDKRLIYALSHGSSGELDEVTVADGSTKQLAIAGSASQPTVSSRGDKLAYSSLFTNSDIRRRDLLQPESPAVELIPSSRAQWNAQYSPDGKRITFASLRSGLQGVWISSNDGTNLVQISNPNYESGSPQWSPDGNRIAFDSHPGEHWEIFVADVAERKPRKLITNISDVIRPHWSRDGKWIYFSSNGSGRMGIYRCPASGGDALLLSKDTDAMSPQESFEGKTVYFASHEKKSTLKKVALPGQPGTESEVEGLPRLSNSRLWALSQGGIYFVPADAPRSLRYFDFATKQVRPIFEADRDFGGGLSVSPDGRWILYSLVGKNSDIMLVDHFR
ncbi:winged helix-turn-helix domain-containing protein [Tunturiibacter lichenicola]|uniref:winged helix-turn-helix domain-containing protein n=1 Tax=Tunturiibacter lichenicola TaxID=2051959 RepID=UPI003D9B5329